MGKERTRLRRHSERGRDDRDLVHAILDEALVCHVGFVADGYPTVIPTLHARSGDTLYLHGSPASRMLQAAPDGEICVTVTLLDGVVMARSAFNHSMNYRSVMVFGRPRVVTDADEKMAAFMTLVEHVAPGRWDDARHPTRSEMIATTVLALSLDEAWQRCEAALPKTTRQTWGWMSGPVWCPCRPPPENPSPTLPWRPASRLQATHGITGATRPYPRTAVD